ncbi:hypothetical protein ABD71_10965 [Brevibacillus laterosporus]|nr:hypothetical protein [Brevibacillus laterosporus]
MINLGNHYFTYCAFYESKFHLHTSCWVSKHHFSFLTDIQYTWRILVHVITDHETGKMLVDAIPLLPSEYPAANLLDSHSYLKIGKAVIVSLNGDNSMPTFDSLGKEHLVVWSDDIE